MKRSWMGFALLILLLLGGILVERLMVDIHEPIEAKLLEAAQAAMDSHWEQAEAIFRQAEDSWETHAHFRSCFADHNPIEEIDASFEMLKVLASARERLSFAGGCRSLARQVAAVGEAQELTWWNLL